MKSRRVNTRDYYLSPQHTPFQTSKYTVTNVRSEYIIYGNMSGERKIVEQGDKHAKKKCIDPFLTVVLM